MKQTPGRILIADDKRAILNSLELLLEDYFEEVVTISNPNQIPALVGKQVFDVYLLDMNFSAGTATGNEGLFWLNKIKELDAEAVVVFITAYGDVELAVKAVKSGGFDFILKPWENQKLIATISAAVKFRKSKNEIDRLTKKEACLKGDVAGAFTLVKGKSKAMEPIYEIIKRVAPTDANVLMLGENGTGKEVIAREIHRQSKRKDEVFFSVDVSALSEGILESELFGHSKGAFTGSIENRHGKFEAASGGTLFMDEIGNMDLQAQAKLLTSLQNRTITPLGSTKEIPIDIRLICATNKNIDNLIKDGQFREDLFYRINTVTINLPPLRERREDILPLVDYYLKMYSQKYDKPDLMINEGTRKKLESNPWKGNIRELRNAVEKAVILSEGNLLSDMDFNITQIDAIFNGPNGLMPLDALEKRAISKAIQVHTGNLSKVAKDLKISRQTLYNKIKKHGL